MMIEENNRNDSLAMIICKHVCAKFIPSGDRDNDYKSILDEIGQEIFDRQQTSIMPTDNSGKSPLQQSYEYLFLIVDDKEEFKLIHKYVNDFLDEKHSIAERK